MKDNFFLLFIMISGILNGVILSLFIISKKKSKGFIKLIAIASLLFSISYIKDFLVYYGNIINFKPRFLIEFTQLTLFVPLFVELAYCRVIEKKIRYIWLYILAGSLPYLLILLLKNHIIPYYSFINSYATSFIDLLTLLMLLKIWFCYKNTANKHYKEFKLISVFLIAYTISTANRLIIILPYYFFKEYSNLIYSLVIAINLIIASLIVYIICINLFIYYIKKRSKKSIKDYTSENSDPRLERIITEIEEDKIFTEKGITIEKLAVIYNIDSKYLSQQIRAYRGVSYNEFLNDLRLKYFIQLLKTSDLKKITIYGLAESAGFNSKSTFNRSFKQKFQMTPSQYAQKEFPEYPKQVSN